MKNEMITYRSDDSEQVLIDAVEKSLNELGMYNGNSSVNTSYELLTALSDAVKRSNLILVLITKSEYIKIKKIVSKSLGIELVKNSTVSRKLGRLSNDKEFQLHDNFPKGSVALESKDGLYSGFYLKSGNQSIIFSPLDPSRTEGILEKAGIKLNIECVYSQKLRFVGVAQAQLDASVKEMGGVKSYTINDLRGELELTTETVGSTNELAREQGRVVAAELKRLYKSRLYGVNVPILAHMVISVLEGEQNQLAIADTDTSSGIVSYLATDRRAGEWCKKIRLSSAHVEAANQNDLSELVQKIRNKSGFELAVALGDEARDEERSRDYIYGAFANEHGVLTKRFWKQNGEADADFRTRCVKELMLLLYNDRTGDEEYGKARKKAHRPNQPKERPVKENPSVTERSVPKAEVQEDPYVTERKNRIAPKEDKSLTRIKVIIMLVLVAVVITVAILVSRGGDDDSSAVNNNAGNSSAATTTTTTVATTTTTLPSCDRCGVLIEDEAKTYVHDDGRTETLCEQDYDFLVKVDG